MNILGIETSCDETAAAIITIEKETGILKSLSNIVSSQIDLHAVWGGVVPNLAAREHLRNILSVIEASLAEAKLHKEDIDLIAVTNGPGLIPALLVGTSTAKAIAYVWKKPLIGIHHIEGHIYANFVNKDPEKIEFPLLCLVVSGGHTQLVLMQKNLTYEIIGQTQDDAVGEAFDKVARILGLGYPGGPIISKMADKFAELKKTGQFPDIHFPRPMLNSPNLDFSFSGLKTAVLYFVKKNEQKLKDEIFIQQVAYEFQQAAIEVLVAKTIQAAKLHAPKRILLAGGVSANTQLQNNLQNAIKKELPEVHYELLDNTYSLDNATMIAAAAFFRHQANRQENAWLSNWRSLSTEANLKLSQK